VDVFSQVERVSETFALHFCG